MTPRAARRPGSDRPGSDRFVHRMPFGAQLLEGGEARFRLWAPNRASVGLLLRDGGAAIPMEPREESWFELTTAAGAGSRYLFELDGGQRVPDPASRTQDGDVHDWSVVADPTAYAWETADWQGRPWAETVLYELHLGAFSPEGTYAGLEAKLDRLRDTGVTAVELMPLADFPGRRGWGYDGVLPYAPDRAYGDPDGLKRLIDGAHARGLMVFLDVVYNHFGPDGNYLHLYADDFFDSRRKTPWGAGIDYERQAVRDFFVHNALYWLREFRFDGLRFDAVDWIKDKPEVTGDEVAFLKELASRVRETIAAEEPDRHVHLVLENDDNRADLLARDPGGRPVFFTAQWNDDWHHAAHALLTGETDGYYGDYADDPAARLGRGLAEGFVYQGEASAHRDGRHRGEPSAHLSPLAFVDFLQNHDQIGNRAFGDRLSELAEPQALEALTVALLLAPQVPLLFMGEEWGAKSRFCFFCDFHDALAEAVRKGRRREFAKFARFADAKARAKIPDPNAESTFALSKLDWAEAETPEARARQALVSRLLSLRQERIVPLLPRIGGGAGCCRTEGALLEVVWTVSGGGRLSLALNHGAAPHPLPDVEGEVLFAWPEGAGAEGSLPGHAAVWRLNGGPAGGQA
jgi:maltooligosyltrehalose trehalohydrolase